MPPQRSNIDDMTCQWYVISELGKITKAGRLKTLKTHNGPKFLFREGTRQDGGEDISISEFYTCIALFIFALQWYFWAFWVNLFLVLLSCGGRFRTGVKYWKPLIKFQTSSRLTDKYAPDPRSLIKTNRPISLSPNKSKKFNSRYKCVPSYQSSAPLWPNSLSF